MKIQRLRNKDIMLILPARQQTRWRLIVHAALDNFYTAAFQTWQDRQIIKDLEELKEELHK